VNYTELVREWEGRIEGEGPGTAAEHKKRSLMTNCKRE
jgi:hypothetical protein